MPVTEDRGKHLLDAVKEMGSDEFDAFIEKALALRNQPKAATLSAEVTKLVQRINRGLPLEMRKRYGKLLQPGW